MLVNHVSSRTCCNIRATPCVQVCYPYFLLDVTGPRPPVHIKFRLKHAETPPANTSSRAERRPSASSFNQRNANTVSRGSRRAAAPPPSTSSLAVLTTAKSLQRRERAEYDKKLLDKAVSDARAAFPHTATTSERNDIIDDWQTRLDPIQWKPVPCAVGGQTKRKREVGLVDPKDINLSLLRNPNLPQRCLPTTYNLVAYDHAILYHRALTDKEYLGAMEMCHSCQKDLLSNKQPLDSMANFQYYARDELPPDVKKVFCNASMFDLMMVSRSRATRITHLYSKKKGHHLAGSKASTSQRYSQGNVAIFVQDVPTVRKLLPPDISDVQEAMCTLFIGSDTIPNRKNIEKLGPILVSKNHIATIIDFLLTENSMYLDAGVEFSTDNMNTLFSPDDSGFDVAVPRGIELCCLPDSDATDPSTSSYTDRGHAISADIPGPAPATYDALQVPRDQIVMEAVGYTVGNSTPQNYDEMKERLL
ncbi:hypothetical protein B0H10DRAFT_2214147 [Mycena sp. CBHHK59/15]|nr:hypothetical protein B0H10DRAFT_2214147 [Mycena sp. CBHHK59/15]